MEVMAEAKFIEHGVLTPAYSKVPVNTALTSRRFFPSWELKPFRVVAVVVGFGGDSPPLAGLIASRCMVIIRKQT